MSDSGLEIHTEPERATAGAARHVVLVGLMGSGKTTLGTLLAERLGRPLVDSDALIEERTGRTVREIWLAEGGESTFRELEAEALLDALVRPEPAVIAAAGGVVLRAGNRAALRTSGATVVWLRGDPAVLAGRAVTGHHRPSLDDDPVGTLRRMASDREALYREVATASVDVGRRPPAELAEEILHIVAAARREAAGGG